VVRKGINLLTVERKPPTKINIQHSQTPMKQLILQPTPLKYHCDYCDKDEHTEDHCYKKKCDMKNGRKGETEKTLCVYETALIIKSIEDGYIND
jgi:hypothetical protein